MALALDEYGKRSSAVFTPAAPAMALCVWEISTWRRYADRCDISGWVNVWTPISSPASTISLTRPGFWATRDPTTKNVALTLCRRSTRRIGGLHCGSGPSANVIAVALGASREALAV